jgi:hypothetical protein
MALISRGNDLDSKVLQPGWTISDDGYGLHTCRAVRVTDVSSGDWPNRGAAFPVAAYAYLKLHKYALTFNGLKLQSAALDFVGIDPSINGGVHTNPQIGTSNGLSAENLTSHPNFYEEPDPPFPGGGVIAGKVYTSSTKGPTVATPTGKVNSYIGENGSCFERQDGGRFIGFVDPEFKHLYGRTSYLAPVSQISGSIYILKGNGYIAKFQDMLGVASQSKDWGGTLPDIIPDYFTSALSAGAGGGKLLLSQVNYEDFGSLVKVNYEVRYAEEGWFPSVYRNIGIG